MDPARLLDHWRRLERVPGGRWLFSRALGWMAPYSGSVGARVLELEPGLAVVGLSDRRKVRQHLGSVHAVALVNLGELATGLAQLSITPPSMRGIVVELCAEYRKKARGTLIARAEAQAPPADRDSEPVVTTEIVDAQGDVVAIVRARWRIGPRKRPAGEAVAAPAAPTTEGDERSATP
jgi:acyl-coenzyme A thioesterase PaaI-like protein